MAPARRAENIVCHTQPHKRRATRVGHDEICGNAHLDVALTDPVDEQRGVEAVRVSLDAPEIDRNCSAGGTAVEKDTDMNHLHDIRVVYSKVVNQPAFDVSGKPGARLAVREVDANVQVRVVSTDVALGDMGAGLTLKRPVVARIGPERHKTGPLTGSPTEVDGPLRNLPRHSIDGLPGHAAWIEKNLRLPNLNAGTFN